MADTRQQILDAARQLFLEQGFDKTSLREVAEKVGVTKAALYYYFPSKDDLLVALLQPVEELSVDFLRFMDAGDVDQWAEGLELFIDWMLQQRDMFELIERNEAAVAELSKRDSSFSNAHQLFHDSLDAAVLDEDLPLERRIQLMCSLGAAIGFLHFGREMDIDANYDEIRTAMVNATRAVLGLRARRPRVATNASTR